MPKNNTISFARSVLFVTLLASSTYSQAAQWSVSGFGTLGYTYESEDNIAYLRDNTQTADPDDDGTFMSDSNLGLQVDATFNWRWSATAQVLLNNSVDYDLEDITELAFVRYTPSANWSFRAGRIGISAYAAADSRHIDYAHLWVRPPQELYGSVSFNNLDGIGVSYFSNNPDFNWSATVEYGQNRQTGELAAANQDYRTKLDDVLSLSLALDQDEWQWQLSYAQVGGLSVEHDELLSSLHAQVKGVADLGVPGISADAQQVYDYLTVNNEPVNYLQAAASYFDGRWCFESEVFKISADQESIPQGVGGYALLGRAFDNITPYAMYGRVKQSNSRYNSSSDWGALDPALAQLQQGTLLGIDSIRIDQSTYSVGVRWDLLPNLALKAQMDHVEIDPYGYGLWATSGEGIDKSRDVQVYTLNMNFIF
ncbi:hypothetical protein [Vibrio nereis]|uniref:hypothetical protein n=1 Tax=Vibrio nereis TaxID=693 RepID=UPI002495798A|nr:hypothetical protein [Vibrio nereis]